MTTFLSIDLDYWASKDYSKYEVYEELEVIFLEFWMDAISKMIRGTEVKEFEEHHHMLKYIHKHMPDRIINIDYHSDVVEEDDPVEVLTEGNWSGFYKGKSDTEFIWRYPDKYYCLDLGYGRCDYEGNVRFSSINHGYASLRHGGGIGSIPWHDVVAIGVCRSPGWVHNKGIYKLWNKVKKVLKKVP